MPFQVLSAIDCISAGFKTRRDRNFQPIVFITSDLHKSHGASDSQQSGL